MTLFVVECGYHSDIGIVGGGSCALGLGGGHPSWGFCNHCNHNPGRLKKVVPRPRFDIPLPGDLVEAAAKRIGADRLAKWWETVSGCNCGCAERKKRINAAAVKLAAWLRR